MAKELTSAQCRAQETLQYERASREPLENVRVVAVSAAIAWGQVALNAERTEARRLRTSTIAELLRIQPEPTVDDDARALSENPDRGFAGI